MAVNAIGKGLGYIWRGAKATPHILFSEGGATALVNGTKTAFQASKGASTGSRIWQAIKGGGKALETSKAASGGIFKSIGSGFKATGAAITAGWKGGTSIGGKILGAAKGLGKAVPVVGNVLAVACAVPTICSAFANGGFGEGMKEIGKEGAKLGGAAIGGAIGGLLGPIGAIVGYGVGYLLTSAFTGKTYSERQQAKEEIYANMNAEYEWKTQQQDSLKQIFGGKA
ncbi:MAG: hypothetical protein E7Z87_04940 [Cyanobacteria bacterium SIG26]|nr:hypothetical protein [Cyanobacteria bacterium SIG26]